MDGKDTISSFKYVNGADNGLPPKREELNSTCIAG
jgi:hypothetical protein